MNLRRHWKLVLLALWCLAVTFSSYHLLTPWACLGFAYFRLRRYGFPDPLEFYRASVAQERVPPLPVVEHLHVLEHL